MTKINAIKTFFEADGGRKVENAELLSLRRDNPSGYEEIARLCAAALNVPLDK